MLLDDQTSDQWEHVVYDQPPTESHWQCNELPSNDYFWLYFGMSLIIFSTL